MQMELPVDRLFDVPEDMLEFGGVDWYPVGEYDWKIQDVFVNTLGSTANGDPFEGFATTEGEQISIQMSDFVPLDGSDTPPSQLVSQFLRIPLRDGQEDYVTVDPSSETHKKLATGKRRLVAIAKALGETPSDDFVSRLKDGEFSGARLQSMFNAWEFEGNDKVVRKGSTPRNFAKSKHL